MFLKPPLFIDNERVLKASFNFVQAQRSFFPEKRYDTIRILQSWRPVPQLGNGALREPLGMGTRWRNFLLPTITTDCLWIVFADLLVQNNVRKTSAVRMKKAKADFFRSKINEVKTSSAYWRLVKNATNLSKCHKSIGPLKRDDGSLTVCDVEKANMMNAYFSSIGTKLAAQLPAYLSALQIETGPADDSTDIPTLAVINIQEGTIKSKILNLKTNKATGPDEIAPRLLRLLGETVVSPLASLFTSSLKSGVVPLEWKTAKLTTVPKKDDETDRGNYRLSPSSTCQARS